MSTYFSQRPLLGPRTAFWIVASTFLLTMAFVTVPTPLYSLYQARDGFETFTVTLVFAAYAVGVIVALLFGGHLSDQVGRRRVLIAAAAIEASSCVLFLLPGSLTTLLSARFVSGIGVGLLTAAATAGLTELRVRHSGEVGVAASVAAIANLGGLAMGPLIGGAFGEWAQWPLVSPYVVFLLALSASVLALPFIPETVELPERSRGYRPPKVAVPEGSRRTFLMAGVGAFTAFAITGFYGSVAPTFLAKAGGVRDHLIVGLVAFAVFGSAAAAQLTSSRLSQRGHVVAGAAGIASGMILLALAAMYESVPPFVVGGIAGGVGAGVMFRSAIASASTLSDARNRGGVLSGVFLMAYSGMTIPPVLLGLALEWVPMEVALVVFASLNGVLSLSAAVGLLRSR